MPSFKELMQSFLYEDVADDDEDEDENCYYTKMNFYEFVDINSLNETNKKEFIYNIEYDLINHGIWNKLKEFFISHINLKPINQSNSNITNIE